ncbi:L,D-transpeptidase family protein [Photobacterium sp. SDRW27]|uniref:L,D-transpeptidase family protein n=1 Tax=Photobacterium obscurum TaxID=2829490 RepID=UPI00224300E0|nr:L,D-transpeptidase family protein [Photobacterium obscurum]MCW8331277.1 L,D-transpeptidase family protein [Photobacterium obscurum]
MFNSNQVVGKHCRRLLSVLAFIPAVSVAQTQLGWQALQGYEPVSQTLLCSQSTNKTCFPTKLESIYAANDYVPLWADEATRQEFFLQFKSLVYAELVPGLEQRLFELEQLSHAPDQRGFDLIATDSFLIYKAVVNLLEAQPSRLYKHHNLQLPQQSPLELINIQLSPLTLMEELQKLRPRGKRLENSVAVAEKFRQRPPHRLMLVNRKVLIREDQPIPNGNALLDVLYGYGDLSRTDYMQLKQQIVVINSGKVNRSIRAFQHRNGLDVDGIIGPATAKQLSLPYSEISRVIALNLQRSRFGSDISDRPLIRVNIPDYMLRITRRDQLLFESKVIVGRTSRPTNLFSSSLNTMVVNPSWNVPTTIKQEDVIPNVKNSLDYLAEKNLKIVKSWRDRSIILPEQIEWSNVNPKTFPYEFQQGPGPSNALGKVKFLMPNDYSIYLHDTPSRSLFRKSKRNLSSGCVRVEKADELAEFILGYQRRSGIAPYQKMVSDMESDTVSLGRRVNVDVMYMTAWVDENNRLQLREDIYGYDRPGNHRIESKFISLKDFSY